MRVLSGRLKAVLVASLATIVLIGVVGPAPTLASDPPGLTRFMAAVGKVESGGDYHARNGGSGAYGKYQIMPSSWRAWADRFLGNANLKATPANQDLVAAGQMRALYRSLGAWRRVAYWWLTGSKQTSGWSSYATRYVGRVMTAYANGAGQPPIDSAKPDTAATTTKTTTTALRHYSEKSRAITYTGRWQSATYSRYAGKWARFATKAGATATFSFSGTKVTWYGAVGRTRGKARVSIDGTFVKTVNLYARSFSAPKAVFTSSWPEAGAHTLTIEVVGTRGHPDVAIDEMTVAN